jgi:ribonuclease Z
LPGTKWQKKPDWYPPDVYRKPNPVWPANFKIDVGKMIRDKVITKVKGMFGSDQ